MNNIYLNDLEQVERINNDSHADNKDKCILLAYLSKFDKEALFIMLLALCICVTLLVTLILQIIEIKNIRSCNKDINILINDYSVLIKRFAELLDNKRSQT